MAEEIIIEESSRHSQEVEEIITSVPSWIVRSGTVVIFSVICVLLGLSAFVQYPDVVKTSMIVNSLNSPKAVVARQNGKLISILVKDKQKVVKNQPLAFLESTASHHDVIQLLKSLEDIRSGLQLNKFSANIAAPRNLNLGELQPAYESFYQSYILFLNTREGGHYLKQKEFLLNDLKAISKLKDNITRQKNTQELEFNNAKQQYMAYKKLMAKSVISISEFKVEENKYLASQYPLQQSDAAFLNNNSILLAKQKEIMDLENTIAEQKSKFMQALNSMINDTDSWMMNYVLTSPVDGIIGFAGILQENQNVKNNDELFIVNPGNSNFFGEINIPQYNMGKIEVGQRALVKLRSFPFEQYGMIRGNVSYLSDVALKDSLFMAKVDFKRFENTDSKHRVVLKNGMIADVEIITEESSLLQRFTRNLTKLLNMN